MPTAATAFTPYAALIGGALIGLSAVMAMALFGRIAGISGIVAQAMRVPAAGATGDWVWRIAFILGLFAAPLAWHAATGAAFVQTVPDSLPLMAGAGLLVGFGAALGSGCTSGHGVCGMARLSPRSLVSVAVFMAVAILTVFVLRHVAGGLS